MPPKKILHIVTKGSPFGGAQKYVYDLATHLPEKEFESVVLVGAGRELVDRLQLACAGRSTDNSIRTIQIPELGRDINLASEWSVFWKLVKIIREEKPDIVHLNSSKIGGLGALAVRLVRLSFFFSPLKAISYKLKAIYTAHGWAFNEKRSLPSLMTIRFFSWITMLLSHTTIVIAKSDEIQARNMPFVKNKVRLVHNGIGKIDFKTKTESREFLQTKMNGTVDKNSLWIGTVAELHKNKNLFALIQAVRLVQEKIVLVIIGEGEERKRLEQQIQMHDLSTKVFLIGKVENASLYLKAFDIFALPSIKEGLPYTLLEAGLAGLPTLSTYVGGIPEIIRNNVSGVLVEPMAEKIQAGLETLINNPDKRKEFGHALKEKVSTDFSLKKMIEKTIEIYKE